MNKIFSIILFLGLMVSCKSSKSVANNAELIRYQETYGSVCCPKDLNHDYNLYKFIEDFENKNSVDINEVYRVILGKEGEATYYLTLNGLNSDLQKQFVKERIASLKVKENVYKEYLESPVNLKDLLPESYMYQTEDKGLDQFKDTETFWK
ncbi:hypothetical protein [Aureivirga sp. CE67]|uniref:hypothetical protein n=1 Tax=Aureivirga sp. CE67 TaxID=1788983 RepID=UPI0018C99863|nr:hypothetical protein [Aureivirga sp. CE67]